MIVRARPCCCGVQVVVARYGTKLVLDLRAFIWLLQTLCAKAIAFEVGSPLKILNTAELVRAQEQGRSKSRLSAAFDDAGLANAVIVLDNFNVLLEVFRCASLLSRGCN